MAFSGNGGNGHASRRRGGTALAEINITPFVDVLLVLLIRAYPQRYVTTPDGLLIRAGLAYRLIPYRAITYIGEDAEQRAPLPLSAETVKIECGPNCEIWLAPEDPSSFFQDMARHTPHLRRRGQALTAAWV